MEGLEYLVCLCSLVGIFVFSWIAYPKPKQVGIAWQMDSNAPWPQNVAHSAISDHGGSVGGGGASVSEYVAGCGGIEMVALAGWAPVVSALAPAVPTVPIVPPDGRPAAGRGA